MFGGKYVWPVPNIETVNTYEKEIANMKRWLKERVAWLDKQLDYDPTSVLIASGEIGQSITGCYSLLGMRLQTRPQKGITIIRYKDGTSRKVNR